MGYRVGAAAATIYVADKAAINAYMNTIREHPDWVLPPGHGGKTDHPRPIQSDHPCRLKLTTPAGGK